MKIVSLRMTLTCLFGVLVINNVNAVNNVYLKVTNMRSFYSKNEDYYYSFYDFCKKYNRIEFIVNDSVKLYGTFKTCKGSRYGYWNIDMGIFTNSSMFSDKHVKVKFSNSRKRYITMIDNVFAEVKPNDTFFLTEQYFVRIDQVYYLKYLKNYKESSFEKETPYVLYVPFIDERKYKGEFMEQSLDEKCSFCLVGKFR